MGPVESITWEPAFDCEGDIQAERIAHLIHIKMSMSSMTAVNTVPVWGGQPPPDMQIAAALSPMAVFKSRALERPVRRGLVSAPVAGLLPRRPVEQRRLSNDHRGAGKTPDRQPAALVAVSLAVGVA